MGRSMASEVSVELQERVINELELHASTDDLNVEKITTGKYNDSFSVRTAERVRMNGNRGKPQDMILQIAPPDDPSLHLFYEYRMMRRLPEIHGRLHSELPEAPIAKILLHIPECDQAGGRDVLVQEALPGQPVSEMGVGPEARDHVLRQLGEFLRKVHQIQGPAYGYPTGATENGSETPSVATADTWRRTFWMMWNKLVKDTEDAGGYTLEEAETMRLKIIQHLDIFERQTVRALLHMDVWDQNILARVNGSVGTIEFTGLVDWDRALYGDPEIEFAVLDYCGVSTPAFWRGYGKPDPRKDDPYAQLRRAYYVLYEMQKYILIRLRRSNDPAGAELFKKRCLELAEAIR